MENYFGAGAAGPGAYAQSVETGIGRLVGGWWRGAVGRGGYPPLTVWRLALRQFPNQRRTNAELTQRCGWLAVLLSGGWSCWRLLVLLASVLVAGRLWLVLLSAGVWLAGPCWRLALR